MSEDNWAHLNRNAPKWSRREQAGRVLWGLAEPLFRFSPRPLWGWRRMLLRLFGAKVGAEAHVYPSVRITIPWNLDIGAQTAIGDRVILYALGKITLGDRVAVSQGAHLCAGSHDLTRRGLPLIKPPIVVGADAWICADAFIGPGVDIGSESVVGARAVVVKNVPKGVIVAGNPARILRKRKIDDRS